MNKILCSVCILTFNSGKTLERALRSVKDFDEIIINDGGSKDNTLEIAKKYNCKIIFQDNKFKNSDGSLADFSGVRNQMIDVAENDWIFILDSDESIDTTIVTEIKEIIFKKGNCYFYSVTPEFIFKDRAVRRSSALPSYQVRLFNKSTKVKYIKKVHEKLDINKDEHKIKKLKGYRQVYMSEEEIKHYPKKINYYLSIEVNRKINLTVNQFIIFFIKSILQIIKRMIKIAINYFYLKKYQRMPISIEFYSIVYVLKLIIIRSKNLTIWQK